MEIAVIPNLHSFGLQGAFKHQQLFDRSKTVFCFRHQEGQKSGRAHHWSRFWHRGAYQRIASQLLFENLSNHESELARLLRMGYYVVSLIPAYRYVRPAKIDSLFSIQYKFGTKRQIRSFKYMFETLDFLKWDLYFFKMRPGWIKNFSNPKRCWFFY